MGTDQNNLYINFSALNVHFSSSSHDFLRLTRTANEDV